MERQERRHSLESAGGAERMTVHRFRGTDQQLLRVLSKNRANGLNLEVESFAGVPVPCALM